MTEAEWLACDDPERMLSDFWPLSRAGSRKYRLCSAALCRRLRPELLAAEFTRHAIDCAERYADDAAEDREREAAWQAAVRGNAPDPVLYAVAKYQTTGQVARVCTQVADRGSLSHPQEEAAHCTILRCVFGNSFRPGADGFLFRPWTADPAWLSSSVLALARQMYEARDFSPMPILADALQDAGCDSADILDHCRGPGPHVRGCWVVDLVLGRA